MRKHTSVRDVSPLDTPDFDLLGSDKDRLATLRRMTRELGLEIDGITLQAQKLLAVLPQPNRRLRPKNEGSFSDYNLTWRG